MQVNRRFLYAGVFLVVIGGVLVLADLDVVDTATVTDALRVWPLAVIALGLGIVLRRTRYGLAGGLVAAALAGLVLGGAFAVGPRSIGDCGARGAPASVASEQGAFNGPATVSVTGGCGSLTVRTAPGNGWRLSVANASGRVPSIASSTQSLSIDSGSEERWRFLTGGRNTLDLVLPTSDIADLSVVAYAEQSHIDPPGARIGRLAITANVSQVVVDASAASIANLSAAVNVGSLSIHLPANSDLVGSLRVGGGELQVCSPPGVGCA
jgi:phage baseplate assembly protein gpV